MKESALSRVTIERCKEIIFDFLPAPVTEKQRKTLEKYRAGNLEETRADTIWGGDYERCLCSLMNATKTDADPISMLSSAAESAIKYAGVADGSELYKKLSEQLPEQFTEDGLNDG
jgi:hypothetical protein